MPRQFNRSTPLGQLMHERGYSVKSLEGSTGISYRTISDYLAGRKTMLPKHIAVFSEEFGVSKDVLLGHATEPKPKPYRGKPATPADITAVWVRKVAEGVAS